MSQASQLKRWVVKQAQQPNPFGNLLLQGMYHWNHRLISRRLNQRLAYRVYTLQLAGKRRCVIIGRSVGMFSFVLQTLEQIDYCQRHGLEPYVYWNSVCPYWTKNGYRQTRNAWEYYFQPVSKLTLQDVTALPAVQLETMSIDQLTAALTTTEVAASSQYLGKLIPELWVNDSQRAYIHKLIEHYLVIDPTVLQQVEDFARDHFTGSKVIGVHLRGMEKYSDLHYTLRGYLPIEYYYKEVDHYLKQYPTAQIFLASDSETLSRQFIDRYGRKVIQSGAQRSSGNSGAIHLNQHDAKLGAQVLVDCLLLAKSDILIHGISNVASAACYFNPDMPHIDLYQAYRRQSFWKWFSGKNRPLDVTWNAV